MKIFYTYTNNFKELLNNFLQSIRDTDLEYFPVNFDYIYDIEEQKKIQRIVQPGGGSQGCKARKNLIDYALMNTQNNEYFIVSDIDIIFYQPIIPYIEALTNSSNCSDIFFQKETDILLENYQTTDVNIGFMIMKNIPSVKSFWDSIYQNVFNNNLWEQPATNEFIKNNYITSVESFIPKNDILPSISILSTDFFCMSHIGCNLSDESLLPRNIILHHATCVLTIEEKLNQFNAIKVEIQKRYGTKY